MLTRRELRLTAEILLILVYAVVLYVGSTVLQEKFDVFEYARF